MKHLKLFLSTLLALSSMVFFISCEKHLNSWSDTYSGSVGSTFSIAKNGDTIQLSLTGHFINTTGKIKGKDVIKSVSYYIGDTLVAVSSDNANDYVTTYEISGLSVGEHEITAKCNTISKKNWVIDFKAFIHPFTLTIEE